MKRLYKCNNVLIAVYLCAMLGFFPLYYKYQYANMGDAKYKFFLYASSACVVVFFLLCIFGRGLECRKFLKTKLDMAVFVYFICTMISFLFSPYKETGFWGASGWNMGFLSQFLFVAVYFILAAAWKYQNWALKMLLVTSSIVFVIAIFHRFDIDLLPIYGDLEENYKIQFLSTMGQSSWYSSFLCTVFPIGLFIFFNDRDKQKRTLAGIYSVIAMMSLVTQNTDSAFLSLFAVVMVLFYLSFDGKLKEFLEVLILIFASFCFIGIFQRIFAAKMILLDSLSLFMSQSVLVWIVLVAAAGIYCWIYGKKLFGQKPGMVFKNKKKNKRVESEPKSIPRMVFWIVFMLIAVAVFLVLLFIVLNTTGVLQKNLGYRSTNNYLLFDNFWGNGRGFAWKFAVSSFADFTVMQKLFGVGPDCFSAYIMSVPEYLEQMRAFWGNLILTNAHNEYLTKMYNIGIIGLVSYVGMLVTAVWTFLKRRGENPLLPAFALCIVSYMVHNIFCYEQVCCTPILYILMGIGSNQVHNYNEKGTY